MGFTARLLPDKFGHWGVLAIDQVARATGQVLQSGAPCVDAKVEVRSKIDFFIAHLKLGNQGVSMTAPQLSQVRSSSESIKFFITTGN